MERMIWVLVGGMALGAGAALAMAGDAKVVTADKPIASPFVRSHDLGGNAELITRAVAEPSAVVPRPLAEQPVWPHLAEVRIGHAQTVFIDPLERYDVSPNGGRIDENHWILRAQRAALAKKESAPHVIYGSDQPTTEPIDFKPLIIFEKPDPNRQRKIDPMKVVRSD